MTVTFATVFVSFEMEGPDPDSDPDSDPEGLFSPLKDDFSIVKCWILVILGSG